MMEEKKSWEMINARVWPEELSYILTSSEILSPWLYIFDSGIGLLYQPYARIDDITQEGTKNLATGLFFP